MPVRLLVFTNKVELIVIQIVKELVCVARFVERAFDITMSFGVVKNLVNFFVWKRVKQLDRHTRNDTFLSPSCSGLKLMSKLSKSVACVQAMCGSLSQLQTFASSSSEITIKTYSAELARMLLNIIRYDEHNEFSRMVDYRV